MKEKLITFETAKLAKEKGFDWKVRYSYGKKEEVSKECLNSYKDANFNYYTGTYWQISAPTQSLLQKWLREVHNIHIIPIWCIDVYSCELYDMRKSIKGCQKNVFGVEWEDNCTYEEALEKGLYQALKLI